MAAIPGLRETGSQFIALTLDRLAVACFRNSRTFRASQLLHFGWGRSNVVVRLPIGKTELRADLRVPVQHEPASIFPVRRLVVAAEQRKLQSLLLSRRNPPAVPMRKPRNSSVAFSYLRRWT